MSRPEIEVPIEYQGFPQTETAFDAGVEACIPHIKNLEARIEELERKLAEQQATVEVLREFAYKTAYYFGKEGYEGYLQEFNSNKGISKVGEVAELDNLLAKAKEEGRKEAVPE